MPKKPKPTLKNKDYYEVDFVYTVDGQKYSAIYNGDKKIPRPGQEIKVSHHQDEYRTRSKVVSEFFVLAVRKFEQEHPDTLDTYAFILEKPCLEE